jgi:hypothetical protein
MTGVKSPGVVAVSFFEVFALGTHPFGDVAPFELRGPGHAVGNLAIDSAHDLAAERTFLDRHRRRTGILAPRACLDKAKLPSIS